MNIPGFIYGNKFSRVKGPDEESFIYWGDWYGKQVEMLDSCHYDEALKEFNEGLVDIVNVYESRKYYGWFVRLSEKAISNPQVRHGQPCEAIPEGDKMRIVKLK